MQNKASLILKRLTNYRRFSTTWGLAILGQDVVIFIISNMAAVVRAGQTSVGICRLSCTFVFQSSAVPGGRFSNPQHRQALPLGASAADYTTDIMTTEKQ